VWRNIAAKKKEKTTLRKQKKWRGGGVKERYAKEKKPTKEKVENKMRGTMRHGGVKTDAQERQHPRAAACTQHTSRKNAFEQDTKRGEKRGTGKGREGVQQGRLLKIPSECDHCFRKKSKNQNS